MANTAHRIARMNLIVTLAALLLAVPGAAAGAGRVVVAWDDPPSGSSFVGALDARPPFALLTPELEVGGDGRVRVAFGMVFHLSRVQGTLTIIDPATWSVARSFALGAASEPRDVAVVDPGTAYVSRRASAALLRIELDSGAMTEAIDLRPLGVGDGNPVMETLLFDDGRLYVQLAGPSAFPPEPHFIGVIDVATQQLVDADPAAPGLQAIALAGTAPRFKMQVVPGTKRLLVSATGVFTDQGGLELVDLDALQTLGVAIREFEGAVGNDLGAFTMLDSDRGWLIFSTDIVLSSHLHPFTLSGGAEVFEADTSLFYFAPHLVYDASTDTLFWPEPDGVQAFEGATGAARAAATALSGNPTDLALLPATPPLPALSPWSVAMLAGLVAACTVAVLRSGGSRRSGGGGAAVADRAAAATQMTGPSRST